MSKPCSQLHPISYLLGADVKLESLERQDHIQLAAWLAGSQHSKIPMQRSVRSLHRSSATSLTRWAMERLQRTLCPHESLPWIG